MLPLLPLSSVSIWRSLGARYDSWLWPLNGDSLSCLEDSSVVTRATLADAHGGIATLSLAGKTVPVELRRIVGCVGTIGVVQARGALKGILLDRGRTSAVPSEGGVSVEGRPRRVGATVLGNRLLLARRHSAGGRTRTSLNHGDGGGLLWILDQSSHTSPHKLLQVMERAVTVCTTVDLGGRSEVQSGLA